MVGPTGKGRVTGNGPGIMTENGSDSSLHLTERGSEGHGFWSLGLNYFSLKHWVTLVYLLNRLCLSFLVCKMEVMNFF